MRCDSATFPPRPEVTVDCRTLIGSHILPVKRNLHHVAVMTRSAQNRLQLLLTSALNLAVQLLPTFSSCSQNVAAFSNTVNNCTLLCCWVVGQPLWLHIIIYETPYSASQTSASELRGKARCSLGPRARDYFLCEMSRATYQPIMHCIPPFESLQYCSALSLCLVSEFGLFFADDDQKKGIWLENNRNLEYYLLRSGVISSFCLCFLRV